MALSGAFRLPLRFERERLSKTGKTIYGKFFIVVVADSQNTKVIFPRLAILLSKKTAPLATDRNKIKRITSGILENLISSIPPKDYLIIPKKSVLFEKNSHLCEDLKNIFQSSHT